MLPMLEKIIQAGYKEDRVNHELDNCDRVFYKKFYRDGKRLFTIGVKFYQLSRYPNGQDGIMFDIRYSLENGDFFDIEYSSQGDDLQAIEAFAHKAFDALGCIPDPHNQD